MSTRIRRPSPSAASSSPRCRTWRATWRPTPRSPPSAWRSWRTAAQAAIASEAAAERFGLAVLRRNIANQAVNLTRFVIVSAAPVDCNPLVQTKVSLVFGTTHERGALVRCLNVVAGEGINVSKLESRPRPGTAWEYHFYVDLEGHLGEPRMQSALAGLAVTTQFVRVLGCYPVCPWRPPL